MIGFLVVFLTATLPLYGCGPTIQPSSIMPLHEADDDKGQIENPTIEDATDPSMLDTLITLYLEAIEIPPGCSFCNEKLTGKNRTVTYHQHLLKNHSDEVNAWFNVVDEEALPELPQEDQAPLPNLPHDKPLPSYSETAPSLRHPEAASASLTTRRCSYDGCKYIAPSFQQLMLHLQFHRKEKPFPCP